MSEQESSLKRTVDTVTSEGDVSIVKRSKIEEDQPSNNSITEQSVGITLYLTPDLPGFSGQIKQRYTDFLVNEIDKSGNVVHLTDKGFKMPKKPQLSKAEKDAKNAEDIANRQNFEVDSELRTQLVEIFGESDVQKIEEVYKMATTMKSEKSFEDKTIRTKIHQLLRSAFNDELESVTSDTNCFKIARNNKNSRVNKKVRNDQTKDANGVENWGYGPAKEFLHFTLQKENKDTMDAVNTICKLMRFPTKAMRFAGTKDRRAVTCQRLSLSKIGVDRLNALNRTLKGMTIGGFKFEDSSLSLGDLNGNEFVIAIRDVNVIDPNSKLEDILQKGCESLSNNGFINYFGMQRFGTYSISTHEVGKEILLENWEKAVELILSDQDNVLPKSKEARQLWESTHDAAAALKLMPRQCVAENSILYCLSNLRKEDDGSYSTNSYLSALMKVPRNLRTMYVHAYQSYVWNAVTSERIKLYGLKVVPGDLVIDNSTSHEDVEELDDFDEDLNTQEFVRAKPLSQEDIDAGNYSMSDIVLPMPGFDIIYPSDSTLKQVYIDIMKKDNMDPFKMRRKVRDFSVAGSYRNVIQKPNELEYKIVHYNESTQQLLNTDLEMLNNKIGKENGQKYMKTKLERFMPDNGGEKTAVLVKMQLGTSAYATMALRELMKLETSRRGDMCDVKV
ncbi:similar to Saccharomyces cerevisiae YOR243C PUS7 Pseudouridine synthase [Maudiozyma saulgeensis]|uniref:Similar to Saccharomyces cerevisiae YOR243C PUS7 Pseudouridine synthase n=1 Tax=Maudiozyma saulgeensis TaxID=1789683 RepID=A0A1X7R406_9SACH|nr:similar to Saccharomyces cerevisiae YOR243C PUS7 Pseudouridine synthase [Kazachstania saulgeensis]